MTIRRRTLWIAFLVSLGICPCSSIFAQRPEPLHWPTNEDLFSINGRVVSDDQVPLAGATVRMNLWSHIPLSDPRTTTVAETVSNNEGRFVLEIHRDRFESFEPQEWRQAAVVTTLSGWGASETLMNELPDEGLLTVVLRPENIIRGTVVDAAGDGIPYVQVSVMDQVTICRTAEVDEWIEQLQQGGSWYQLFRTLKNTSTLHAKSGAIEPTVQARMDGSFEINGIPGDAFVTLGVSKPGIESKSFSIINRDIEAIEFHQRGPGRREQTAMVFGERAKLVIDACRPITGTVTDVETGEPIAGVRVYCRYDGKSYLSVRHFPPDRVAETDANGRYVLEGVAPSEYVRLEIIPPLHLDRPFLLRSIFQNDLPADDSILINIELNKGIWISGRVTESESGDGVFSMVFYNPLAENEHANALLPFKTTSSGSMNFCQFVYSTDSNGRFRVPGLKGRAVLGATPYHQWERYCRGVGYQDLLDEIGVLSAESGWLYILCNEENERPTRYSPSVITSIDPPEDATEVSRDLHLELGKDLQVTILHEDIGDTGTLINGHDMIETAEVQGKPIILPNMAKDEKRRLRIVNKHDSVGRVVDVSLDDAVDGNVTVELKPLAKIKGRLIDSSGIGIDGWWVSTTYLNHGAPGVMSTRGTIDGDGNFVLDGLPTPFNYRVHIGRFSDKKILVIENTIQAGDTFDVGTIDISKIWTGRGEKQIEKITARNIADR